MMHDFLDTNVQDCAAMHREAREFITSRYRVVINYVEK